jgi:hypothetical protein
VPDAHYRIVGFEDDDKCGQQTTGTTIERILLRTRKIDNAPSWDFSGPVYLGFDAAVAKSQSRCTGWGSSAPPPPAPTTVSPATPLSPIPPTSSQIPVEPLHDAAQPLDAVRRLAGAGHTMALVRETQQLDRETVASEIETGSAGDASSQ